MGIKTSKNRTTIRTSMISASTQLGVPPLPSGSDITTMRSLSLPYGFSGSSVELNYPLANQSSTNGIKGAAISSDGKKMYFVETYNVTYGGTYIHQYTLSKAWDVTTAIYDYVKFNYNPGTPAYTGSIESLTFSPNGYSMFLLNASADVIIEYTLSTAWNVSSASYTRNASYALGAAISNEAIGLDMKWSTDGTSIYILGNTNKRIYQFTCNTAWTLASGITYTTKSFLWNGAGQFTGASAGGELNATALFFNGAGTILYIWGSTHAWVMQWSLSTPWDISTATRIAPDAFPLQFNGSGISNPTTWFFGNSGTMLYTADGTVSVITQLSVPIAYNPNIRVYNQFFTATGSAGQRQIDFFMKPDGTKIITYGSAVSTGPKYYSFTLSTPYDISTMTYDSVVRTLIAADAGSVSGGLNVASYNGMFISTDGTKLYRSVAISAGDTIMQYTLTTPWDISTLTYDNINMGITPSLYIPDQNNGHFCFSADGVYLFVLLSITTSSMIPAGLSAQRIRRYTLTTPWDISSRTNPISTDMMSKIYADQPSASGTGTSGNICGIRFNSTGKTCYIWNFDHFTLYQFVLSSPYDLQTAIYAGYKTMHGFVMDLVSSRPFSVQIVNGSLYMLTDLNSGANDGNSSYMLQFGLG